MKELPLLQFSHNFCLKLPELLDCEGQEPPYLIRQTSDHCYRLSQYRDGAWAETDYFFDPAKEQLEFIYSKDRGFEVFKKELSNGCGLSIERERFTQQMVPQKTEFAPCLFLYGYMGPDRYLCLEKQNGPIVCRAEDGARLWQTEETYLWPGNHWPAITREWVEILDFDRHILSVYSLDGERIKTCRFPTAFLDAQYSPRLYKDGSIYYMEGFWEDITKYVRVYLTENRAVETLFTVPPEVYAVNCTMFREKFLYTGEEYRGAQYGDAGVLAFQKAGKYITKKVFFHPGIQRDVGGGNIKWLDDQRFYYWKPSNKTNLTCYDIDGHKLFQVGILGYFDDFDITVFQNRTYILSHRDCKGSRGWAGNRDYSFSVFVDSTEKAEPGV